MEIVFFFVENVPQVPAQQNNPGIPIILQQYKGPHSKKMFPRHSSFDVICNVAEQERNKLYGSYSQPTSPGLTSELCTTDIVVFSIYDAQQKVSLL